MITPLTARAPLDLPGGPQPRLSIGRKIRPCRLVILGAPGAGKGTQAAALSRSDGLEHLSIGEIMRTAGTRFRRFTQRSEIADANTIREIFQTTLAPPVPPRLVVDGIRRASTAAILDEFLGEPPISLAIVLTVPEDVARGRLVARADCAACGITYGLSHPPRRDGTCDQCIGLLLRRPDDRQPQIDRRLADYAAHDEPVRAYYAERSMLIEVDGNRPPPAVATDIQRYMG